MVQKEILTLAQYWQNDIILCVSVRVYVFARRKLYIAVKYGTHVEVDGEWVRLYITSSSSSYHVLFEYSYYVSDLIVSVIHVYHWLSRESDCLLFLSHIIVCISLWLSFAYSIHSGIIWDMCYCVCRLTCGVTWFLWN